MPKSQSGQIETAIPWLRGARRDDFSARIGKANGGSIFAVAAALIFSHVSLPLYSIIAIPTGRYYVFS